MDTCLGPSLGKAGDDPDGEWESSAVAPRPWAAAGHLRLTLVLTSFSLGCISCGDSKLVPSTHCREDRCFLLIREAFR